MRQPDDDDDGIAVPCVHLDIDLVRFDAINGRRTDLGQHGGSYDGSGFKALSRIRVPIDQSWGWPRPSPSRSGSPLLPIPGFSSSVDDTDYLHPLAIMQVKHLEREPADQCAAGLSVCLCVTQGILLDLPEDRSDLGKKFVTQALLPRLIPAELLSHIGLRLRPDGQSEAHLFREVMRA